MREQDPVQTKLQEITEQMVRVVQVCNEAKGLIEDEFIAVRQDLKLIDVQMCTEKAWIEGEVSGVGGQMIIQQAMIDEIRHGIMILYKQDNLIIKEAGDIFQGIRNKIHDYLKKRTDNGSTLVNHRRSIMKLPEDVKKIIMTNINLTSTMEAMDRFIKTLPTKDDISTHANAMGEALAKIQEVSTGLTVHMEEYTMSGSTTHAPRSIQAGPSYTHPDRHPQAEDNYEYKSSLSTQDDARPYYGLQGGDGSASEEEDLNVPEDRQPGLSQPGPSGPPLAGPPGPPPPGPLGPPPPDPPGPPPPSGKRKCRAKVQPIKLKDPYSFEGKPGEDFDAWWIIVQIFIQDQPEKFDNSGRTINWIRGFLRQFAAAWHVQWERQALAGKFPRSWTTYQNDLMLRFEDKEARDKAYADLQKVRYMGDIRDMFTKIQM